MGIRFRATRFLVIGGASTLFQFTALWVMITADISAPVANLVSLLASICLNYTLHYRITWNDRLPKGRTTLQNMALYALLCGVFYACSGVTITMKIVVFGSLFRLIGWFPAVATGEVLGVGVNYLTADRVSFGWMVKAATWLTKSFGPKPVVTLMEERIG